MPLNQDNQDADEMMRGESGLLSALDEPGSSNLFHMQRDSNIQQPKRTTYYLILS